VDGGVGLSAFVSPRIPSSLSWRRVTAVDVVVVLCLVISLPATPDPCQKYPSTFVVDQI